MPAVFLLFSLIFSAAGGILLARGSTGRTRLAIVEQRLQDLKRMRTASQTYRSVIYVEEKSFWKGRKNVLFTVEYEVAAGVDFSKGVSISRLSGNTVQVNMPPAEIFSADADERSIHQMKIYEPAFFNPVSMGDYMPQIIAQGVENREAALESGILQTAEKNARNAVRRVLSMGGIQNVVFSGEANER